LGVITAYSIHCVDPILSDSSYGELANKLAGQSHQIGAKYVMFNNMFSKQDSLRFLQTQNVKSGNTYY